MNARKPITAIVSFLTLTSVLTGCTQGEQQSTPSSTFVSETSDNSDAVYPGVVEDMHTSVLDEKIKTTLTLKENVLHADDDSEAVGISLALFDGVYIPNRFGVGFFPGSLVQRDPCTCELAGIVDNTTIYTVYRVNDEKIGDYYVYNFYSSYGAVNAKPFEKADDISLAVKEADIAGKNLQEKSIPIDYNNLRAWGWDVAGLEIRVAKHLSAKDFDGITIGSTIEEVTSVDPITAISLPSEDIGLEDANLKLDTFHYTDDGILRISFAREAVEEEFLVSEIELNKTFEVGLNGSFAVEGEPTVKLKINPEHLPD